MMFRPGLFLLALLLGCGPDLDERLEHARTLAEEGQFEELVRELTPLTYEAPDHPEINHLYGVALLRTGNSGMAVWPLRQAANTPGREVEDGLLLAQALARGAVPFDAIDAIDRVLGFEPERIEAWTLRAQVNHTIKRYADMLGDCEHLLAIDASRPDALLCQVKALSSLERFEDAEQALAEGRERLAAGGGARPRVERSLCSVSAELARAKEDIPEAGRRWEACVELAPTALDLLRPALRFFDESQDPERGTELLERAVSLEPQRFELTAALSERLARLGRDAESERILIEATRADATSRPAWLALAEHYRQRDEFEKAIRAVDAALAQNPSLPTFVLAQFADDLIQAHDIERADQVIQQLPDHPMVALLRGRSYLVQGDPAAALEEFEAGLLLWPGNPTARYLAGQAAEQLGDFDRAIAEYRNALRADAAHTQAGLDLARILEAEGEYPAALTALRHRADAVPDEPDAHIAALRIARKAGAAGAAADSLHALSELPDQQQTFAIESAALLRLQRGPRAAADFILNSELDLDDPGNAEALGALVSHLAEAGAAEEALQRVERALASHPEEAALHELRGTALLATGKPPELARAAYERALELEPERATTLGQLGRMAADAGDGEAAVAFYDRARASDPEHSQYAWRAIKLLAEAGDEAQLDARLLDLLDRDPLHAGAARMRAERLLAQGEDLGEAERLAMRAVRFGGGTRAAVTRARIAVARGDPEAARQILERLEGLGPRSPSAWYALGVAYEEAGDTERARTALARALEAGDFPEAAGARQALARLEGERS